MKHMDAETELLRGSLGEALFYILERGDPQWLGSEIEGKLISVWEDLPTEVRSSYAETAEEFAVRNSDVITKLAERLQLLMP